MNIKEKLKQALIDMWPDELYHDFVTGIFLYLKTEELQQILLEEIISGEIDNPSDAILCALDLVNPDEDMADDKMKIK